jgi:hypothetical protein
MNGARGVNALICAGLSAAVAISFFFIARWMVEAPPLAIFGGMVWVFILSMIVSLPLITGWMRRRGNGGRESA